MFLTVGPEVEPEGDVDVGEVSGGLYAVLRFEGFDNIGEAWERLWDWIEGPSTSTSAGGRGSTAGAMTSRRT